MARVAVILPAAGSGTRFGSERNKIFQPLGGRPLFLRTLELFTARPDVCAVRMAVSEADEAYLLDEFGAVLDEMGVVVVRGGGVRSESVRNALADVTDAADLVAVHDAVRPCVSQSLLDAVFSEAEACGAAILAEPVHGTVKRAGPGGAIRQTVCREGLWQAQTPQVFRRDLLRAAYEQEGLESVTDDAQLVERLGHEVRIVPGDPRNIKITTPADLAYAEAALTTMGP